MDYWGFESRSRLPGHLFGLFENVGQTTAAQPQKAALLWDSDGKGNFQPVTGAEIEVKPDGLASEDEITAARKAYEAQTGNDGATVKLAWAEENGDRSLLVTADADKAAEKTPKNEEKKVPEKNRKSKGAENRDRGYAVVDSPYDSDPAPHRDYYVREANRMGLYGTPSFSVPARAGNQGSPYEAPLRTSYAPRTYAMDIQSFEPTPPQADFSTDQTTVWLDLDRDGIGDMEVPLLDVQLKKADGMIDDEEQGLLYDAFRDAVCGGVYGDLPEDTRPEDLYFAVRNADGELVGVNGGQALGLKKGGKKEKAEDKENKEPKAEAKGKKEPEKEDSEALSCDAEAARRAANTSGRA